MESFFNTKINSELETDSVLYNIINSQDPKVVFIYALIIIGITFVSLKISYSLNLLIGLIFSSLIIYYLYTYRKYNTLTEKEIYKEKFDILYTKNQILKKYPKIVDFLFYMENLKSKDIEKFDDLQKSFKNFCTVYEYCLINYNLIFQCYKILVDQKILILNIIENYNLVLLKNKYENILFKQRESAENIINELLNNLVILYKKKIYYDGYNNSTNLIHFNKVLPYNILYDSKYKINEFPYNFENLIFF